MTADYTVHELQPGTASGLWAGFYTLPKLVYAADSNWVRESPPAVRAAVEREDLADRQLALLAAHAGRPVARLVARVAHGLRHDEPGATGLIGFFESLNEPAAAAALFARAMAWLDERGIRRMIGPLDGDTWHRYRLNLGPWHTPPFFMEPYNPPHYPELWTAFGFRPVAQYHSKRVADMAKVLPHLEPFRRRSERNGFTFRPFDVARFDAELGLMHELSCAIFAENPFYSPISRAAFRALYAGSRAIITSRLVWFSLDRQERPNGFVFAMPDYFLAMRAMRGRRNLVARLQFLWRRRLADTLNVKTIGVIPKARRTGLGPALLHQALASGLALGLRQANLCLMHDDNVSSKMDGGEGVVSRRYALYQYRWQGGAAPGDDFEPRQDDRPSR